eukprot:c35765_g1_i1.p1 GENE.c35765_g1_i1~~c35765_g1_i1.p1  ORF type:complete len:227 (+),score=47.33 c35765_g1_i1:168-848(+)
MVCDKVQSKRKTTYNEVSDELVRDFQQQPEGSKLMDEKNIRRRVYDALNVLIALDIITKDRKQIVWRGLPGKSVDEIAQLQQRRADLERSIKEKREKLRNLVALEVTYRALMTRNGENSAYLGDQFKVHMPFILVNTENETQITCEMNPTKEQFYFSFNKPFEIHEDVEVLRWARFDHMHQPKDFLDPRLLPYAPGQMDAGNPEPSTSPNHNPSEGWVSRNATPFS